MDQPTTRRAMLAAAVAAPVVAFLTLPPASASAAPLGLPASPAWDRRLARLRRLAREQSHFERFHLNGLGMNVAEEIWDDPTAGAALRAQIDRAERIYGDLVRRTDRALRLLLQTPAPTLAAVVVKLDLWREHNCADCADNFSLDPIFADVRRLA